MIGMVCGLHFCGIAQSPHTFPRFLSLSPMKIPSKFTSFKFIAQNPVEQLNMIIDLLGIFPFVDKMDV
jgi:hypothetical protein